MREAERTRKAPGITAAVAFTGGIISQRRWPDVFEMVSAHWETESKKLISRSRLRLKPLGHVITRFNRTGHGRLPVLGLLDSADGLRAFLEENKGKLKLKSKA